MKLIDEIEAGLNGTVEEKLKQIENLNFILEMKDHWDSDDFDRSLALKNLQKKYKALQNG